MKDIKELRQAMHEIDPIHVARWSPRAFSNQEVPESVLYSIFEAARWAPSAANIQPWHFIYARTAEDRDTFLQFINPNNARWCKEAPVLVAVMSKIDAERFGGYNIAHAFDTGTAWGFLALEAARKGLVTHAMGGFDREQAKQLLDIPENYEVHAIVAVGYHGETESLPEDLREREIPSGRKAIDEFTSEGRF